MNCDSLCSAFIKLSIVSLSSLFARELFASMAFNLIKLQWFDYQYLECRTLYSLIKGFDIRRVICEKTSMMAGNLDFLGSFEEQTDQWLIKTPVEPFEHAWCLYLKFHEFDLMLVFELSANSVII